MPIVKTAQAMKTLAVRRARRGPRHRPGSVKDFAAWSRTTGNELVEQSVGRRRLPLRHPPEVRHRHDHATLDAVAEPIDPLAEAIADVDGVPEVTATRPGRRAPTKAKELVIVNWSAATSRRSGPSLILASTAAASGVRDHGLRDLLGPAALRQGREADHRRELDAEDAVGDAAAGHRPPEALQDELPGHGALDDGHASRKQYSVASPRELLEAATPWASSSSRAR